jgi:hypothetical protein
VTKSVETLTAGSQVADVMRRAISLMRMGRPGPVMVEIPADLVNEEVPEALIDAYRSVKVPSAGANARDIEPAARVLREARRPVIHAGRGVLSWSFHAFIAGPLAASPGDPRPLDAGLNPRSLRRLAGVANFGDVSIDRDGLRVRIVDGTGQPRVVHTVIAE